MKIFDDDETIVQHINGGSTVVTPDFDPLEPSTLAPDESKLRADYIKSITAKVKFLLDTTELYDELPEGSVPQILLETAGKDPEKIFTLIFKWLRGPRGFNGSVENLVTLSPNQWSALKYKDPNKYYFVIDEDEESTEEINEHILSGGAIENHIYTSSGTITNHILTI